MSRPARRLIASSGVSAIGTGFVLPIILIYLHRVRHLPLTTTGLLMTIPGVVGLIVVPLCGTLIDRVGARLVLAVSLSTLALAEVGMGFVTGIAWAAVVLLVRGAALSPTFPAFNTLIGSLTQGHVQQRAFAINFTLLNAGIGVGSLVGSVVIDVHHPWTFQVMFFGDAIASLAAGLVVLGIRTGAADSTVNDGPHAGEPDGNGGYRQVLADPALRRLVAVTLLLALCGYAALDSGLPAYANVVAGVAPRVVALALTANTLAIVLLQLIVLRLLRGRRRSRAIAVVGLIWSGSWVLLGVSALPASPTMRAALVLIFAAVYGVGECFMAPSVSPLINALAPPNLRGRANALTGGMYSMAFVVSPAISAAFIAAGLGGVWIGLLSAGCLIVTLCAVQLGRGLRPDQDIAAETDELVVEFDPHPDAERWL
jgi:MFS family permease